MSDTERNAGRSGPSLGAVIGVAILAAGISGGGVYYALTHDITITPRVQAPEPAPVTAAPRIEGETEEALPPLSASGQADVLAEDLPPLEAGTADAVVTETLTGAPLAETVLGPSTIEQAITLSPELSRVIAEARILKDGQSPLDWGRDNMGYIPKAAPGEVIPGLERVESAPDQWIVGDAESEGGGEVATRYFSVSGTVDVADDGLLTVDGTNILLSGIMTPGADASCTAKDGASYDCQAWVVSGLRQHIAGKQAFCSVSEEAGVNYGLCDVLIAEDGKAVDLASWMVSAGLAVAHDVPAPSLYHDQEAQAKGLMVGLWEGTFAFGGREQTAVAVPPAAPPEG